jgi:DNA-binding response OmpR family regulator
MQMIGRKILIIDDDVLLAQAVKRKFESNGFKVELAATGAEGFEAITQAAPDLVLLDLSLPDIDGTEICREVRRNSTLPVIMLTGRTEETDRVVGLELGADDYVTKPFSVSELLARAKAVLRRTTATPMLANAEAQGDNNHRLSASGIEVDTRAHEVTVDGNPAVLTPIEYKLLCVLMENKGRVMSPQELLKEAWDYDQYDAHLVEVHIGNLRQKIEDNPRRPQRIITVRSFGYKFV